MKCLTVVGLVLLLVVAGCDWLPRQRTPVAAPALKVDPAAPVRAERITRENAYEQARLLNDELDQDQVEPK